MRNKQRFACHAEPGLEYDAEYLFGVEQRLASAEPSLVTAGKSAERPVLSEDQIEHNVQSIQVLLEKLLSRSDVEHAGLTAALPKPLLLNNLDWFGAMPFLTFLRQVCCSACTQPVPLHPIYLSCMTCARQHPIASCTLHVSL